MSLFCQTGSRYPYFSSSEKSGENTIWNCMASYILDFFLLKVNRLIWLRNMYNPHVYNKIWFGSCFTFIGPNGGYERPWRWSFVWQTRFCIFYSWWHRGLYYLLFSFLELLISLKQKLLTLYIIPFSPCYRRKELRLI